MKTLRTHLSAAALIAAGSIGAFAMIASAQVGGPTVVLSTTATTTSGASSYDVTATFSESVNGFTESDITVTNGQTAQFAGSGSTYTFRITPWSSGPVSVSIAADRATSSTNVGNQMSNTLQFNQSQTDTTAPTISGVTVTGITNACATIGWTTNESTTGLIAYGPTTSYGSTATTSAGMSSSKQLCGLNASTTYNYKITATDAAGNTASTTNATFMTLASSSTSTAPTISNTMVTVLGTSSVRISWNTNVGATGFLSYGTTTSYGTNTAMTSTASTSHSVTLTNLQEATLYHYRITATSTGGTATSSDATFVTSSTGSSTPLALVSTEAIRTTAVADGTFENGFKWVLTFTVPDNETNLQMRFTDFTSGSNTIPAANNIRIYSTQSSNATSTANALTSTNNEYGTVMTLTGDSHPATPGRQVQVTVEVRVPFGTPPATGYTTTFGVRTAVPTP